MDPFASSLAGKTESPTAVRTDPYSIVGSTARNSAGSTYAARNIFLELLGIILELLVVMMLVQLVLELLITVQLLIEMLVILVIQLGY